MKVKELIEKLKSLNQNATVMLLEQIRGFSPMTGAMEAHGVKTGEFGEGIGLYEARNKDVPGRTLKCVVLW